jgi:sterol desaturase/sphingolipid hydroxylase (fatty acid hydroxylase superfamily)
LGYIGYDMIHYAVHHAPMRSPLARLLKHNHMRHHYQTDTLGYGVTSPLWDYMFATRLPSNNRRQATLLPIQDCSADKDS